MTEPPAEPPNCLHRPSSDAVSWTTGNVGEAVPGVQTPLSYTFWTLPFERTVRGSYAEMGVLPRREAHRHPDRVEDIALGVLYGRAVLNVNLILEVGAALPGVTAAQVAANVLGTTDLAVLPPDRPARYPVVAVKLPLTAARLRRRMNRLDRQTDRLWREVRTITGPVRARAALPAIRAAFTDALLNHSHATFLANASFEQLAALVAVTDAEVSLSDLLSGHGGMLEVTMLARLWGVAHDQETLEQWLEDYGYLGPYAGNLASRSWREDPAPLLRLRDTYRRVPEHEAPTAIERRRRAIRRHAEQTLLTALPARERARARLLLALAAHFIPLREVGKNMHLKAGDAARATIRLLGRDYHRNGLLDDPEDIWFATWDDIVTAPAAVTFAHLDERRELFRRYQALDIPAVFTGTPPPNPLRTTPTGDAVHTLEGIGACGGVVEGRARVISDPTEVDTLHNGEILVAAATDPSWTTLFLGAAAVVIDVGGHLSHGAIVARELGIPCVTNVRNATAALRTGELIRVDGDSGTVTRIGDGPADAAPLDTARPTTHGAPGRRTG